MVAVERETAVVAMARVVAEMAAVVKASARVEDSVAAAKAAAAGLAAEEMAKVAVVRVAGSASSARRRTPQQTGWARLRSRLSPSPMLLSGRRNPQHAVRSCLTRER